VYIIKILLWYKDFLLLKQLYHQFAQNAKEKEENLVKLPKSKIFTISLFGQWA